MRIKTSAQEYAKLKKAEKEIKERLSEISPEVTSWVQELGGKVELEDGSNLVIVTRRDWQYPEYIEKKVTTLKQKATEMEKIYQIKNPDRWEASFNLRFDEAKVVRNHG